MSLKLIVVALLMADIATSVAAQKQKFVTHLVCQHNTDCTCENPTITNITVGQCEKVTNGYQLIEDCSADADVVGVLKTFEENNPKCVTGKLIFSGDGACVPIGYRSAKCDGNAITIMSDCPTDQCNENECASEVTLSNTDSCVHVLHSYYKLSAAVDCTNFDTAGITLKQYSDEDCSEDEADVTFSKACTAFEWGKGTCKKEDSKVTIDLCRDSSCQNCISGEDPSQIPDFDFDISFNTPGKYFIGKTYISSCEANQPFTVEHYTSTTLKTECGTADGASTKNTCVLPSTAPPATTAAPGGDDTSDNNDNNNDNTNNNDNNDGSNATDQDGVLGASAHTVGVLAVVLCLLACVY